VRDFAVGDEVTAMADSNGDGGWAAGGHGGYALARDFLAVKKPRSVSFRDAAALPICFIAAFLGLHRNVNPDDTVYIPAERAG
jgi:NADPH:quinone reductase-like Zn-dependent oxidoreductase